LPTLLAKREVFEWLKQGKKTIDVRKGKPQHGDTLLFISGPYRLTMKIVGTQSGALSELVRQDNFQQVIPSAVTLEDALAYLRGIYGCCDGCFTAYTVVP
jgi:ASC-1-like (ASCH) protein